MFQGIDPDRALKMVRESQVIAYDTETTGVDINARIVGYVVSDADASVYVPVRHDGGGNIPDPESFESALAEAFGMRRERGLLVVGHHLSFDLDMSARHGIDLGDNLEDTEINEGLIDNSVTLYNLEASADRHGVHAKLGSELYAELARRFGGVPDRKQMSNYWRLPGDLEVAVDYATGDGITTLALWQAQQRHLDELDLRKVHRLECQLIPYLARIKRRGMKIDSAKAATINTDLDVQIKEAKSKFPAGFNVRSPKEVEQLFRSQGITDFDLTPQGKPSFKEKWLETNEIGQAILSVRQLEKARDSFITPLIDTHNINGRVHATLNQSKNDEFGTVSGRLSCSDPNLQAFPKRNKRVGKVVRQLVVPDYGDIYEADFEQQEPRLFGHYSEDENLLAGYRKFPPDDIHTTASTITGRPRDVAKRLGLGILTGMGPPSLAGHMGWSLTDAKAAHNEFLGSAFPGIKDLQETAKSVARQKGYIRTILGRIARYPDPRFAYKAVSGIIQGSGADHMKTALLWACQFAEAQPDMDILMSIHDSIIFQAERDAKWKELVMLIESVPQHEDFQLLLPIPVEVARGKNWAESSYGDPIRKEKLGGWVDGV